MDAEPRRYCARPPRLERHRASRACPKICLFGVWQAEGALADTIEVIARPERRTPRLRAPAEPDGTVTLLFTDSEDSRNDGGLETLVARPLSTHNAIVRTRPTRMVASIKSQGRLCRLQSARRGCKRYWIQRGSSASREAQKFRVDRLHTEKAKVRSFFGETSNLARARWGSQGARSWSPRC